MTDMLDPQVASLMLASSIDDRGELTDDQVPSKETMSKDSSSEVFGGVGGFERALVAGGA
jgi:hypothetical protein